MFFVAILALMIGGDVLWWVWADARLRRTDARWWWRAALATFAGLMLGYLLFFILFPWQGRHAHHWMPVYPLAGIYVWHLFVLPGTLLGILVIGTIVRIRRWIKHRFAHGHAASKETPDQSPKATDGGSSQRGLSRRELIAAAAVAAPPLILGGTV